MGYAPTIPYGFMQIGCQAEAVIAVNPIAADYDINNIVIPSYNQPLTYAYMDLACHSVYDQAGAANWLTAGQWGINDTGATFRAAGSIPNWLFRVAANAWEYGNFYAYGSTNIASYITSGATQMMKLHNAESEDDPLSMFGVYGVLRMYFLG